MAELARALPLPSLVQGHLGLGLVVALIDEPMVASLEWDKEHRAAVLPPPYHQARGLAHRHHPSNPNLPLLDLLGRHGGVATLAWPSRGRRRPAHH